MACTNIEITAQASQSFAQLSGDFNPLHLDPERARRLEFGSTITHGVHSSLLVLDHYLCQYQDDSTLEVTDFNVSFFNPLETGQSMQVELPELQLDTQVKIIGRHAGNKILVVKFKLNKTDRQPRNNIPDETAEGLALIEQEPPQDETHQGSIQLKFHHALGKQLFPHLVAHLDSQWIAQALASTAIVGMQCPGLHSIYSSLHLQRSDRGSEKTTLEYSTQSYDERFRMITLDLKSDQLIGKIVAFYRAKPVPQKTVHQLAESVSNEQFAGQHALVVGGTRGVGETTAKILAAGGAQVTVTYMMGKQDAERVAKEINDFGGKCNILQLDVNEPASVNAAVTKTAGEISHIYYFASPRIPVNKNGRWDGEAYTTLSNTYTTALAQLSQAIRAKRPRNLPLALYYPSSVYITDNEKNFPEYIAAKAAGEAICAYLEQHSNIKVYTPRLPRMYTDQTSGLGKEASAATEEVMLDSLKAFAITVAPLRQDAAA